MDTSNIVEPLFTKHNVIELRYPPDSPDIVYSKKKFLPEHSFPFEMFQERIFEYNGQVSQRFFLNLANGLATIFQGFLELDKLGEFWKM